VASLLRAAGIRLVTLAEHYGVPQDEDVADTTWITETAERGWIAFHKDKRIRSKIAERAKILETGARCFCLTSGNLRTTEMAERFVQNIAAIERACAEPGPFLYSVHATKIERLILTLPPR
jgi:hypothetical protein